MIVTCYQLKLSCPDRAVDEYEISLILLTTLFLDIIVRFMSLCVTILKFS